MNKNKLVQGQCPYCDSSNIEYGSGQFLEADGVYYPAHCLDCKKDFEEHYTLAFDGCYVFDSVGNSVWVFEGESLPDNIDNEDNELEILDESYLKSLLK